MCDIRFSSNLSNALKNCSVILKFISFISVKCDIMTFNSEIYHTLRIYSTFIWIQVKLRVFVYPFSFELSENVFYIPGTKMLKND